MLRKLAIALRVGALTANRATINQLRNERFPQIGMVGLSAGLGLLGYFGLFTSPQKKHTEMPENLANEAIEEKLEEISHIAFKLGLIETRHDMNPGAEESDKFTIDELLKSLKNTRAEFLKNILDEDGYPFPPVDDLIKAARVAGSATYLAAIRDPKGRDLDCASEWLYVDMQATQKKSLDAITAINRRQKEGQTFKGENYAKF